MTPSRGRKAKAARKRRPLDRAEVAARSVLGHQLFEQGRLAQARDVFQELVDAKIEDAYPHTMLGTIFLALGEQEQALELFETALALDSTDLAARVYRGEIRLNRGKLNLALDDLQLTVKLGQPSDPFVARARRLIQLARDLASGKVR